MEVSGWLRAVGGAHSGIERSLPVMEIGPVA